MSINETPLADETRGAQDDTEPLTTNQDKQTSQRFQAAAPPPTRGRFLHVPRRLTTAAIRQLAYLLPAEASRLAPAHPARREIHLTFPAVDSTHITMTIGSGYVAISETPCLHGSPFRCASCDKAGEVPSKVWAMAGVVLSAMFGAVMTERRNDRVPRSVSVVWQKNNPPEPCYAGGP